MSTKKRKRRDWWWVTRGTETVHVHLRATRKPNSHWGGSVERMCYLRFRQFTGVTIREFGCKKVRFRAEVVE